MESKIWHKKDFLLKNYWDEQKSLQEIGDMFGITGSHIHYHMKKHDIPRRSCIDHTVKTRKKMSDIKKKLYQSGQLTPWSLGISRSIEEKRKISETLKQRYKAGEIKPWNKGKKGLQSWTEEQRKRHSQKICGRKHSQEHVIKRVKAYKEWCLENPDFFRGKNNPFYGKKHSKESREKMGLSRLGEKNHRWLGGYSYKDYPLEFNEVLKRQIRERDNYTCQVCGKYGNCVHHIDYDKTNNKPKNLITLCKSDHINTNNNRACWIEFFNK